MKDKVELNDDELEKVSGGIATAMGWSSYQGPWNYGHC